MLKQDLAKNKNPNAHYDFTVNSSINSNKSKPTHTSQYYDFVSKTADDSDTTRQNDILVLIPQNKPGLSQSPTSNLPIKIVETKSLPIQITTASNQANAVKFQESDKNVLNALPIQQQQRRPLIKIKSSTITCANESVRVKPTEFKIINAKNDPAQREFDRTIESAQTNSQSATNALNDNTNINHNNNSTIDNQHMMWVRLIQATMDAT